MFYSLQNDTKLFAIIETGNGYRSSHRGCSTKNVFIKILQNPQENTYVGVSFLFQGLQLYLKKDSVTGAIFL